MRAVFVLSTPKAGCNSALRRQNEISPNQGSHFEPMNRCDERFGVPAQAGSANIAGHTGDRPKPELQTEVHGQNHWSHFGQH